MNESTNENIQASITKENNVMKMCPIDPAEAALCDSCM